MRGRGSSSTGANNVPMPFVRRFGPSDGEEAEAPPPPPPAPSDEYSVAPPPPPSSNNGDGSVRERGDRRRSRSRDRDRRKRSRSPGSKKKKKKRSRSGSRDRHRSSRRSRSRSDSYEDRKRRRRSRSDSRKRDYDEDRHGVVRMPHLPSPVREAAAKLPPQIRGQVMAQSLLVKPEALPSVINEATQNAVATPVDVAPERRKKSRWSTAKSFVPGMPTILPSNLDDTQRKAYLLQLEVEEATRKLRLGDFGSSDDPNRSPSPEPVYDSNGKRLNTREVRKRQELDSLRHEKIQALLALNPEYKAPADYRAPNIRMHDKVFIPQDNHPEINFVGLLIGPRGNTLKALEMETQAKIIIRGKGSVKEGKLGRRDGAAMPGENEPLHAYITGPDREIINRAVARINEIINAALLIPDGQNELRKLQLRELAVLNGTLRPEDILGGTRCSNCGSDLHKTWECPEAQNVTASIICTICGGAGHIARDCKGPKEGYYGEMQMDDEYSALMAELGEKPKVGMAQPQSTAGFVPQPLNTVTDFSALNLTTILNNADQTPSGFQQRNYKLPSGAPVNRYVKGKSDSGSLPPPPPFLSAWNRDEAAAYSESQNYYGYQMEGYGDPSAAGGWVPPPPPPPEMGGWDPSAYPMPVPPPGGDALELLAPPPPPPPPTES